MPEKKKINASQLASAMSMQNISYFMCLAEFRNVTSAAESLFISRQALSKQIKKMETDLSTTLFDRYYSGVELTDSGRKIYELYKPLYEKWCETNVELQTYLYEDNQIIRLAYSSLFSYEIAAKPLVDLLEKNKLGHVELSVIEKMSDWEALNSNTIDLLLSADFKPSTPSDIEVHSIASEKGVILIADNHPWYKKRKVSLADINKGTLVVFEDRPVYGSKAYMPQLRQTKRLSVTNTNSFLANLRRGKAFGITGDRFLALPDGLKRLPLPKELQFDHEIVLAFKKTHPNAKGFRKLVKTLQEHFSE